jgi:hypothetical protein
MVSDAAAEFRASEPVSRGLSERGRRAAKRRSLCVRSRDLPALPEQHARRAAQSAAIPLHSKRQRTRLRDRVVDGWKSLTPVQDAAGCVAPR